MRVARLTYSVIEDGLEQPVESDRLDNQRCQRVWRQSAALGFSRQRDRDRRRLNQNLKINRDNFRSASLAPTPFDLRDVLRLALQRKSDVAGFAAILDHANNRRCLAVWARPHMGLPHHVSGDDHVALGALACRFLASRACCALPECQCTKRAPHSRPRGE